MKIFLEGSVGDDKVPRRVDLTEFPVTIGRSPECTVAIDDTQTSRQHAQIDFRDSLLLISDLGSTNGTFVNRQRISEPTVINDGDVLHFSSHEFLLRVLESEPEVSDGEVTVVGAGTLPNHFPLQAREFGEMIDKGMVRGFHQIITDNRGELYGYELLGRGAHPGIGTSPYEMFKLAQALDMEIELSELLRRRSFAEAEAAGISAPLFFNSHPKESRNADRLLKELERLRKLHPSLELVFEVHEAAVTDLKMMAEMKDALRGMDIRLAYDDFGAGQARLLELAEVPPDILKFDIGLVANVTEPDSPRYRLLSSLNTLVQNMGIPTLAEGIETETVAGACQDIGIDYFQGFYFGRPEPIGD